MSQDGEDLGEAWCTQSPLPGAWGLSAGDRLARDPVGSPMLGGGCRTLIGCPRIASSAPHWGGAWIALFQGAQ